MKLAYQPLAVLSGACDVAHAGQALALALEAANHPDAGKEQKTAVHGARLMLLNTIDRYRREVEEKP